MLLQQIHLYWIHKYNQVNFIPYNPKVLKEFIIYTCNESLMTNQNALSWHFSILFYNHVLMYMYSYIIVVPTSFTESHSGVGVWVVRQQETGGPQQKRCPQIGKLCKNKPFLEP